MKDTTEYEVYYFDLDKNKLWGRSKDYAMALQMIDEIKSCRNESKVVCVLEVKKKVIKKVML